MELKDKMKLNVPMELKEVSQAIGWSDNHIRTLIKNNGFPYCQPGKNKNKYFLWQDIQRWLKNQSYTESRIWKKDK